MLFGLTNPDNLLVLPAPSIAASGGSNDGVAPTLARTVDVRMPGLHLRRFTLHRPTADRAVLEPHPRGWAKTVLFLEEAAAAEAKSPAAGTVMVLPPGPGRRGQLAGDRLQSCLVFDFQLTDRSSPPASANVLPRAELLAVREQLAFLLRAPAGEGIRREWEGAVVILNLLVTLLRATGWLEPAVPCPGTPGDSAMNRLLLTMPLTSPLQQVVQRSGYQRDHLNRLVKRETGLTLGQLRTRRRLSRAKELLAHGVKVGDVAGEIGLLDQSYFARWFRRQTGFCPSDWLQARGKRLPLRPVLCH
ncbi:MAG TPA: helix-turn-helix transcriptional regulator [Candidatus Didemnitutus sp.]|jgi:AraC family L-rhamnose operon transcriptional activator RhaR